MLYFPWRKNIIFIAKFDMTSRILFITILQITFTFSWSQYLGNRVYRSLQAHVKYLSSDELEGRLTGTEGERKAHEYIAAQWKKAGVSPAGSNGYLQPFEFTYRIVPANDNKLLLESISDGEFKLIGNNDYYPVSGSGSASLTAECVKVGYGIYTPELNYNDYAGHTDLEGKIFVIDISNPEAGSVHSRFADFDIQKRIAKAKEMGAVAVIFINPSGRGEEPSEIISTKVSSHEIPVVFVKDASFFKNDGFKVTLDIILKRETRIGNNILGVINNKAPYTVVIGAHYDHLGYGEENSLHKGERAVHNGADDNASGTAVLLELAKYLKKSKLKKFNYLFIGFSGEELGLLGSSYFTKSNLFSNYQVNYMLNMDMVGRLDSTDRTIIINGAGTSPFWNSKLTSIQAGKLKVKTTESGIGPSDHTSFYLKDIPVLHFFTGTHTDYHKPSDDWEKVNVQGMVDVADYMIALIEATEKQGKLDFTKTKEPETGKVTSFKVSLGVVPDYAFEGQGMRIDGVSEGKPAQKAGLKAGDVIIQIGDEKIKDIYAYMAALGKFAKGQTVEIRFIRDGKEEVLSVSF